MKIFFFPKLTFLYSWPLLKTLSSSYFESVAAVTSEFLYNCTFGKRGNNERVEEGKSNVSDFTQDNPPPATRWYFFYLSKQWTLIDKKPGPRYTNSFPYSFSNQIHLIQLFLLPLRLWRSHSICLFQFLLCNYRPVSFFKIRQNSPLIITYSWCNSFWPPSNMKTKYPSLLQSNSKILK